MELRHLKYFVAVAEEQHYNRAAARLHVSQPAVSRQIKDLEDELDVILVFRNGHKIVGLTSAGKHLLAHARDILRRVKKTSEGMGHFKRSGDGKLAIGISFFEPTLVGITMSAVLSFEEKHPNVELEFLELTPQDQFESLRSRRIDVGFFGPVWEKLKAEFETVPVLKYFVDVILPKSHPLAAHKNIKLGDLSGESLVFPAKKTYPGSFEALFKLCQKVGFTPSIRHQANSFAAILSLIEAGKGISLLPEEFSCLPHPNTLFIKLADPALELSSTAVYRKSSKSQITTDLINTVIEYSSRYRKKHVADTKSPS